MFKMYISTQKMTITQVKMCQRIKSTFKKKCA